MSWVCTNCRREYADAPEDVCTSCGNATVVPADAQEDQPFSTARGAMDGESPDSGILNTNPIVGLAFRLVVLAALVVAVVVAVALLV